MSSLSRLLQPKSIAVIGGGAWCTSVVEQCRKMGFEGPVWPVHPTKTEVAGVAAFATLHDLPGVPDASFIGVNRNATIDTVAKLRAMGAGGAVCFASGFREAQAETGDGNSLQDALLKAAGDMPIIGPNCYGFINYLDGALLWPDQHGGARVDRGVAVLTQSSNMAINISMQRRGLPLAYLGTAGNQAQLGLSDLGHALLEDPRVTALGLHIEGVGDLRGFEAMAARARDLGKPIVALKAGRSDQAQAAAVSHTASLAGSDAGARALLSRLGIAQVSSLTALMETLKLLHFTGPLPSNRIISMSCSGGEASLMADTAMDHDVDFPALNEAQHTGLRDALGPMVALANPLDYHTFIWMDGPRMGQTFAAAMGGDVAIGCLIVDFPREDRCDPAAWDCIYEGGRRAVAQTGKPLALVATMPETFSDAVTTRIIDEGMIPMLGLDDTLEAIAAAAFLGRAHHDAAPLLLPGQINGAQTLTEADAKSALSQHGVLIPRAMQVPRAELAKAATQTGFPLVLKLQGVAHKTEAGGVALGLQSAQAVDQAAQAMQGDSFLLEEMITGTVAELLIGVVRDPAHGFVLTLAAGGTLTEILQDSATLLLPTTAAEIDVALSTLRMAPVLDGYRGKPAANRRAIVNTALAVQDYVTTHAHRVEEVEINPLICTPDRAVAADALIRIAPEGETDD
ncbi:MAG: acetate--CoA ligase family protein [Pseudomonadota bacterium]